jgi:hypothetical protein
MLCLLELVNKVIVGLSEKRTKTLSFTAFSVGAGTTSSHDLEN